MKFETDEAERCVTLTVPRKLYCDDSLRVTAHVFENRCEVYHSVAGASHRLTLQSRRRKAEAAELEALAGEFLNELLNQEYRGYVSRVNRKASELILTQTLLSARGGEAPVKRPDAEDGPEFKAEVDRMLAAAREEIERTMPKRLPPQGRPLPPAPEDTSV